MKYIKIALCIFGFIILINLFNQPSNKPNNISNASPAVIEVKPDIKPTKPTPEMTRQEFFSKCREHIKPAIFKEECEGKTVLLEGVITHIDSNNNVRINIDDGVSWHVDLDKTTPRYQQGTRVEFSATLDEQMGWGAHMKNGHFWAKLSNAGTAKDKEEMNASETTKQKYEQNKTVLDQMCWYLLEHSAREGGVDYESIMQVFGGTFGTWHTTLDAKGNGYSQGIFRAQNGLGMMTPHKMRCSIKNYEIVGMEEIK